MMKAQTFRDKVKKWLASEKAKLEGKTTAQKVQYVIGYYWIPILAAAFGIGFLIFAVYRMNFVPHENWLYGYFVNTMGPGGNRSELWNDFEEYAGYDLKEKNLEFNASVWFDPSKPGGTNNSYFQSFVAVTEAGTLDFVTMEKEGLAELGRSGRLLDLNSESAAPIRGKYEDRFVTCIPYDEEYSTDPVPVGIDLSDSLLVSKYHLYDGSCVLGIGAYSSNLESVEKFLEFVLGE